MNNNYDMNIENSRMQNQNQVNMNHNPYINHQNHMNMHGNGLYANQFAQNSMNNNSMISNNVNQNNTNNLINNGDFIKGALIGAAVTFLLTNKGAQDSIMKAATKGTELFQAGMEELKERYEDARAQMEANQE